jgi:Domain of unknown function (DUF927)
VDIRKFLASVVAWGSGGYVTVHWQRPDRKWPGRSCRSIDEMLRVVADVLTTEDSNIFFCLSTQRINSGKRSRENALALRSLFVDIDIDSDDPTKYATVAEAIASLLHFCQLVGIPPPSYIVLTGGGLHAYWVSNKDLLVDEWQAFADAFKALAASTEPRLKIDGVVTGDAARVLRVPDTMNYKYDPPRPVRLLPKYSTGIEHDFSVAFAEMLKLAPAENKPMAKVIPIANAFKHRPIKNLGEGIDINKAPPIPFKHIKDECAWLRTALETGGKDYDQPQWNLTTLCATFMEEGHVLAHRFADKHSEYIFRKTEELWERKNRERGAKNIGWPSCGAISSAGSTHCKSCKHFAAGRSPLNIGYDAFAPAARAEAAAEEIKFLGGECPPDYRLPEGYAIDEEGRICKYIPTEIGKGGKPIPGKLIVLFLSQIWGPTFQFKDGQFGLGFTAATERDGSTEVFLSTPNCYKPEMLTQLKKKSVLYATGKGPTDMAEGFMVSWLDKLRKEDKAARDPGTMGWRYEKEDGTRTGFVYGNTLYSTNGDELPLRTAGDDEFRSWYMPQGQREVWLRAAKLLTDRKRPELNIIIAVAFAAPLATFVGTMYGAILSVWGEPGTSKSTAQQLAAAVYGHPKQTRESLNSTPKSIQGRLGRTRNLPAYWDDVQDEKHQEALFQTMFVASEGAEGGRLNPDASYKQRLEWQTLLVACSNASFVDFLTKKQKSTTAGMRRVFEIEFNKTDNEQGMVNPIFASQTFQELEHHYGVIGAEYAKMLVTEHDQIAQLVTETTDRFRKRVEGRGDESFWWNICGVLLAGATLAGRLGVDLDVPEMERFLGLAFQKNREIRGSEATEGGTYDHSEQALTGFLNFAVGNGNALYVDKHFSNRHRTINTLGTRLLAGREIFVEVARDERSIAISRKALREYLRDHEIQVRPVFNGLVKFFGAEERRLSLGAGTNFGQAQEPVFVIEIAPGEHEILEDILIAQGKAEPMSGV